MAWHWTAQPEADAGFGAELTFPSQGEAETWLGEFFPELVEEGVRTVTLYEADRRVYGPMSLAADAS